MRDVTPAPRAVTRRVVQPIEAPPDDGETAFLRPLRYHPVLPSGDWLRVPDDTNTRQ